LLEGGVGAGT